MLPRAPKHNEEGPKVKVCQSAGRLVLTGSAAKDQAKLVNNCHEVMKLSETEPLEEALDQV